MADINENKKAEEVLKEPTDAAAQECCEAAGDTEEAAAQTAAAEDEMGACEGEKEPAPKAEKHKKRADKKTDALTEKVNELEDRVKRQMAEFENFRKRTDKEKSAMFETGARSVIEKILPVVDNFERGLATVPEDEAGSPFAEGMGMIYKQLMDELDKMDVKPIEAVGNEFDPNLHNAVMQVASEEYETGYVAQELLKGYTYRDTVIRHSMVAVVE